MPAYQEAVDKLVTRAAAARTALEAQAFAAAAATIAHLNSEQGAARTPR